MVTLRSFWTQLCVEYFEEASRNRQELSQNLTGAAYRPTYLSPVAGCTNQLPLLTPATIDLDIIVAVSPTIKLVNKLINNVIRFPT